MEYRNVSDNIPGERGEVMFRVGNRLQTTLQSKTLITKEIGGSRHWPMPLTFTHQHDVKIYHHSLIITRFKS